MTCVVKLARGTKFVDGTLLLEVFYYRAHCDMRHRLVNALLLIYCSIRNLVNCCTVLYCGWVLHIIG